MRNIRVLFAAVPSLIVAMATVGIVHAQGMENEMDRGMMPRASDRAECMSMMREGMSKMGPSMMDQRMGHGMMGGSMTMGSDGRGMIGGGMMGGGGARPGMGGLFGSRVTPVMNLSVDDVRSYLDMRLARLNNKRLKIGDIKSDDTTITADVVTVDNSLVQRLKVDRHTGAIDYEG